MKKAIQSVIQSTVSVFTVFLGLSPSVFAAGAMPTGTDYLADLTKNIKSGGGTVIVLIALAAFLWVSWMALAKFNEVRKGQGEWAEVIILAIIAAAILVFISVLVTGAETALGTLP